MPTYLHKCNLCQEEFELEYSIKASPPKDCLLCSNLDCVSRLIAGGTGGKVELSPEEFKASLKDWRRKELQDVQKNEKKLANYVGEDKYHQNELHSSKYR